MSKVSQVKTFPRVPTGISGLDTILHGGLLRGGIYLVMGPPGAGKTILANQIGFHQVAQGKRALYVSLLSEGHGRLFGHLKPFRFFDEAAISDSFNFISAYQVLEKDGLEGLLQSLAHMVRQYRADVLFLDGVASAEDLARSPTSFKKFVHDLNTVLNTSNCTAILLSSFDTNLAHPEHTMVDGIISLSDRELAMRSVRLLEVKKLRGSPQLRGKHLFIITDDGISVFPRIEAAYGLVAPTSEPPRENLSTGIEKLDQLMGGGLVSGSITSLLGVAGTGKTTFGSEFLIEGAKRDEVGLYFGFYETPHRLIRKMQDLGMDLQSYVDQGKVHMIWHPPDEHAFDQLSHTLLDLIRRYQVKRLFIDGIVGLQIGLGEPTRLQRAFAALTNELRNMGVTTYFSEENDFVPEGYRTPTSEHSGISDNIVYLRHIDCRTHFERYLSVAKTRETHSTSKVHLFTIDKGGVKIGIPLLEIETPKRSPSAALASGGRGNKREKQKRSKK